MLCAVFQLAAPGISQSNETEIITRIENEHLLFPDKPSYSEQESYFPSVAGEFQLSKQINSNYFVQFKLFARHDFRDTVRTRYDVREMFLQHQARNYTLHLGVRKLFWGVTESNHLADIINQNDFLEGFNNDQKLGQLLWQNTWVLKQGTIELMYLPVHRRARFSGEKGRLRPPLYPGNRDEITDQYTTGSGRFYPSFVGRYASAFNDLDLGVTYLHGLAKTPFITENMEIKYPVINQFGVDIQYAFKGLLLKNESMLQINQYENYMASVAGFEYTFDNVLNTGFNIGLLSEYLYDGRREMSLSGRDNDLFTGIRFTRNDIHSTQLLLGGIFDLEKQSKMYNVKVSRRLNEKVKITLDGVFFSSISQEEVIYLFKQDSYLKAAISYFF